MNELLNTFITSERSSPVRRHYEWATDVVEYENMLQQRNQVVTTPRRHWFLQWSLMDETDRDSLLELFQRARGRYGTFLFEDDKDMVGAGHLPADGTDLFQMYHIYYDGESESFNETKKEISAVTSVKVSGVSKSSPGDYTYGATTGILDFGVAPKRYSIVDSDVGGKWFKVAGDRQTDFPDASTMEVTDSDDSDNDGEYIVASTSFDAVNTTIICTTAPASNNESGGYCCQYVEFEFEFYYRVMFAQDVLEDLMNFPDLWNVTDLEIIEVKPT